MNGRDDDWTKCRQAQRTFGDTGPWIRHLARAWQAVNAPAGLEVPLPPDPTEEFVRSSPAAEDGGDRHSDVLAYWGPLTHLLCFGLGWARPDLGLARWVDQGAPTDDPILRLVARWWGTERILDFLAWAGAEQRVVPFGRRIAAAGAYHRFDDTPVVDRYRDRRDTEAWQRVWGGGTHALHLLAHSESPMTYPDGELASGFDPVPHWGNSHSASGPVEVPRMVIVNDTYRAWHALLWHYRPGKSANGRSIRTDIVIKPVGWMGEYRHSTQTGAWFRGRHRWHILGN